MHNLDRTQTQFDGSFGDQEAGYSAFEADLFESEGGSELYSQGEGEWFEYDQGDGSLDEAWEMEMAAELLAVSNEQELDQFLGNLLKKVGRGVRGVAQRVMPALGGVLKNVARKALPILGGAAGGFIGGPAGAALGSKLAGAAGGLFGLELEGLSPEDQEFETARRYVRFADAAARVLAQMPPGIDPRQAVRNAIMTAAQRYAPGLLREIDAGGAPTGGLSTGGSPMGGVGAGPGAAPGGRKRSGRWYRRGNRIILIGV